MDAKALAKSKRAHSLHHSKKHHPGQASKTSKGSVTATTSSKKPDNKGDKQKSPQSQGSRTLPSNWDRYEDEYDTGFEDVAHRSAGQAPDVLMPKSKGADYAHLISEAKARSQSSYFAESFTLCNDILDEFNQGLGPLLFSRGQHLASSSFDDNFLLDDKETSSHEASFLSLNLHCLAEQLEKISLADRIFIEPDLLPQELCIELQENTGEEPNEGQRASSDTGAVEVVSDGVCSNAVSQEKLKVHQSSDYVTSDSGKSICNSGPTSTSGGFLDNAVDSLWELDEARNTTSRNFTSDLTTDSTSEKPLRFDAVVAEAELDLLLDSLGETKLFDSSVRKQPSGTPYIPQGLSNQSTFISKSVKDSQMMVAANIDDDIDDLLSETSDLINKNRTSPLHETKAASAGAPSTTTVPNSDSKVLDDFDSWLDTI